MCKAWQDSDGREHRAGPVGFNAIAALCQCKAQCARNKSNWLVYRLFSEKKVRFMSVQLCAKARFNLQMQKYSCSEESHSYLD